MAASETPQQNTKEILVIEDERTLANMIQFALERAGYSVKVAENIRDGMSILRDHLPDLLLLDIVLPDGSGFDILADMKKTETFPKLPVIIISNSGEEVEINRALKQGVADHLVKVNMDPEDVVAKVRHVLQDAATNAEKDSKHANMQEKTPENLSGGAASNANAHTIMLVEDSEVLLDALDRHFKSAGYHTIPTQHAGSAKQALAEHAEVIDVILLDIILPDVNGFDFLAELKETREWKEIPVVVVSNLGQNEEIEKGLKAGATDYILKSNYTPQEIVQRITETLQEQTSSSG